MSSRLIIAAGDISSSPVLGRRFRGKTAKEIYRYGKGIVITDSVIKPVGNIPGKLTKKVVYTAVGQIGETPIGYVSGIGFVRYFYKVVQPAKLQATPRLVSNVACLPITLYSKGIGWAFDLFQLSNLEKFSVYIFDDNRVSTFHDLFEILEENN